MRNTPEPVTAIDAGPDGAPAVSVIVPCFRHAGPLARCLQALAGQRFDAPFEVIVVDSAADPEVAAAASSAGVRLVRNTRPSPRLRPGDARNLGARQARGTVLAFTDADCVPDPEWLAGAVAALAAGARLAGGPVLDARPLHPIAASDNLLQFAEFPPSRPDGPATHFPGCNMAVRRTDFNVVGGFPTVRLPAGEDTAFCNAVLARWPNGLRFTRGMRVRHAGRTGLLAFLRHHTTFGFCRGALGLHLRPVHRRIGVRASMIVPVALGRLSYVLRRSGQWAPASLPRIVLLLPLLLPGLVAWAVGFRRGLLAARGESA